MRRGVRSAVLAAMASAGLAAAALAHSGATGIVKQRMDRMGEIGEATKAIGQMVQGKTAWDPDAVRTHAAAISRASGTAITELFPTDSIMGPSEARPEIWSDWDRFSRIAEDLKQRAAALADGAANARDGSPQAPEALFAAMAGTCKACHEDFRIKK